jgi:hypothetical protein
MGVCLVSLTSSVRDDGVKMAESQAGSGRGNVTKHGLFAADVQSEMAVTVITRPPESCLGAVGFRPVLNPLISSNLRSRYKGRCRPLFSREGT